MDPGNGILQVRGGISLHCQHFFPRKHIVEGTVLGKIRIFYRTQANYFCPSLDLLLGKVCVFLPDHLGCPFDRFFQQIDQFDRFSIPRLDRLVIIPQNGAKPYMIELGQGLFFRLKPFACGKEQLFKMVPLPAISHINNLLCLPFLLAVGQGGQISGCIVACPVRFPDNKGLLGKSLVLRVKDHQGTVILLADMVAGQSMVNIVHFVPVKTFPQGMVEPYIEQFVYVKEGGHADIPNFFPQLQIFRVSVLEFYQFLPRLGEGSLILLYPGISLSVQVLQPGNRVVPQVVQRYCLFFDGQ